MCNYCTKSKPCYYHQKVEDGLIEAPEETTDYIDMMRTVWDYMPLVRSQSEFLDQFCDLGYEDLCQQGFTILADLAFKIRWDEMDPPQISSYIKSTVSGGMRNYISKMNGTIAIPHFFEKDKQKVDVSVAGLGDDNEFSSDAPSPEETLLRKEALERAHVRVASLIGDFNERELFVLWNHMVDDEPMTMREVAKQFKTSKDSILRDAKRVRSMLMIEEEI